MVMRIVAALALLVLGACCCGPPTEPEQRRHAVRLEGRYYLLASDEAFVPAAGAALGAEHARVERMIDCDGVIVRDAGIEDPCGFRDGDSDVLPAGTTLHPVDDVPAGQRLAAVRDGRLMIFHAHFPPD